MDHKLGREVAKFKEEYSELRAEMESLLANNSRKTRHRIIGAFTAAGAITEKILLWIIHYNGREPKLRELDGRQGLAEYRKIIQDIIPKQQTIHINTINQWRNLVAHANNIDDVDEHEINGMNSALKSLAEWFFEDYLGEEYAQLPEKEKEEDMSTVTHQTTPSTEQTLPIKSKIKWVKWLVLPSLVMALIVLLPDIKHFTYSGAEEKTIPVKKDITKVEAYDILIKYFNSIRDKNTNACDFFANKITQFYLYKNINPTKVDLIRKMDMDYIDRRDVIDKESLSLYGKINDVSYWRFWNDFACYRTTKDKFQTCKVLMEFGFNKDRKITSIKEIKVLGLKFSRKKPY